MIKNLPTVQEMQGQSLGWEDPLEKEMAPCSNILAWKSYGQRNLEGYSARGCKEPDMTEATSSTHILNRILQMFGIRINRNQRQAFTLKKKKSLLLFSHSVVSDPLQSHGLQYARLPCASLSPGVCSNSCPLSL